MSKNGSEARYLKAKAIALEVLDGDPDERQSMIDRRCGADEALREEVFWLIEAAQDSAADEVPEQFQAATQRALKNVSLEVPLPRNYRLIRRLNQGGMGIVYLAERIDGDIRQRVAFKLLHLSETPDESLSARFATEQQILSRLSHPNIAHLIDAGMTAEGRPFLATEYVDGERIDKWCTRNHASIRDRLDLFLRVCDAVDYAHRHMVIHRDIKPPNILVTPEGEPKLLDFGIAYLLDSTERSDETAQHPVAGLTMAYASPEQIEGRGLSAATDVYSLGAVLHELLTQVDGRQRLPGDLEWIVHKAMQHQPQQRYGSVKDLSEDLQRFLEYRPVQARHGHVLYRSWRFVRRHRWGVAAGLVAVAMLLAFLVDREMQLQRIAWERDRAEAVTEFMNEMFAGADSLPSRGNEVTVREILDLGTEQLRQADEQSPALLGSMYLAIGRAYNGLGLGEQALPLLREAQRVLSSSVRMDEWALIQAEVGAALDSSGRAIEAIEADRRAIELFEQASGSFPDEILRIRIRKLRNHANVLDVPLEETIAELNRIIAELEARPESSRELLFEAKAALVGAHVFQDAAGPALQTALTARLLAEELYQPDDPRRLRGRYVYATALMLSDPEAAADMYASLIDDHERLVGPSQRLANRIGNFGVALSRVGRDREAMHAFSRAAEMIESLAGRNHYLYRLSISNLAALHLRQDEPQEAEALVREILTDLDWRFEQVGGIETRYRASALDILGSALTLQGRLEEAAETYTEALDLLNAETAGDWPELEATIAARLAEVRSELQP